MTKDEMIHLLRTDVPEWNRRRGEGLLPRPNLTSADLGGANLRGANLRGANLSFADFSGAYFCRADLSGSNLSWARLANAEFANAVMLNADLRMIELHHTHFRNADLRGTDLSFSDLLCASLFNANLSGAHLRETRVRQSNLTAASLKWSELSETQFIKSDMMHTDFGEARLFNACFIDVDLSNTMGLESVNHLGPSKIDVDTIYRSQGHISEKFLRDAGVPEGLIIQIPSLIEAQEGIQFYSCFISYSHKDEEFAERLHGRLRVAKLRVWYAPEEMKGGEKIHEQIETAIRLYDKLLLVISEASLQSEWVKTEIRNARRAEKKTGKRKLFPVRLTDFDAIREWSEFDADSGKDLGVELREYFIPDFSEWKDHDKFEAAFAKLLRDLKADSAPAR